MPGKELTSRQKKAGFDLIIIVAVTAAALAIYTGFQSFFISFTKDKDINVLLRTLVIALMQYGVAGLGITVVSIYRNESFASYGLKRKGLVLSVAGSALAFVPYAVFSFAAGHINGYMPFKSVWMTKELLSAGFPVNISGLLLITAAWGFFEGFNYVVISGKINTRFPLSNKWFNPGAVICGLLCILIHGVVGLSPESIIEAVTVFIIIYGMLTVKDHTGNAWGSVFVFIFLWNAF